MSLIDAIQQAINEGQYQFAQISAPTRIVGATEDGWAEREKTGVKIITLVE